ncbi:uncharacterized protein LOC118438602 [Folsomia candida]|uniref:uncharacterized protein LOC118438602 n=1 Tax=Folsomia candida TaxID=158441 RepID=UPI001604B0F8|nr:uncharacterized protein LOC118438602 [Folsomia candida]
MIGWIKLLVFFSVFSYLQCATLEGSFTSTTETSDFECPSYCAFCSEEICHKYNGTFYYDDEVPGWVFWVIGIELAIILIVLIAVIWSCCFCCRCCCFASYPKDLKKQDDYLMDEIPLPECEKHHGQHVNRLAEKC